MPFFFPQVTLWYMFSHGNSTLLKELNSSLSNTSFYTSLSMGPQVLFITDHVNFALNRYRITCLLINFLLLFWPIPIFDHVESITEFIFPVFRGVKVVVVVFRFCPWERLQGFDSNYYIHTNFVKSIWATQNLIYSGYLQFLVFLS